MGRVSRLAGRHASWRALTVKPDTDRRTRWERVPAADRAGAQRAARNSKRSCSSSAGIPRLTTRSRRVRRRKLRMKCHTGYEGRCRTGGLVAAERHPFARHRGRSRPDCWSFQRNHPRLTPPAVVLAVAKVVTALLGLAVLIRLLLRRYWTGSPSGTRPSICRPSVARHRLDDIPWPESIARAAVPTWLRVIIGNAKFWLRC